MTFTANLLQLPFSKASFTSPQAPLEGVEVKVALNTEAMYTVSFPELHSQLLSLVVCATKSCGVGAGNETSNETR